MASGPSIPPDLLWISLTSGCVWSSSRFSQRVGTRIRKAYGCGRVGGTYRIPWRYDLVLRGPIESMERTRPNPVSSWVILPPTSRWRPVSIGGELRNLIAACAVAASKADRLRDGRGGRKECPWRQPPWLHQKRRERARQRQSPSWYLWRTTAVAAECQSGFRRTKISGGAIHAAPLLEVFGATDFFSRKVVYDVLLGRHAPNSAGGSP